MEKIKAFLKKPTTLGLIGLSIGLIFGLVVLGWWLWPVVWVDGSPKDLQSDWQRDYLCMTIDSYVRNQDKALMQVRWNALGDAGPSLVNSLTPAICRFSQNTEIEAFKAVVGITAPVASAEQPYQGNPLATPDTANKSGGFSILPFLFAAFLVLAAIAAAIFLFVKKGIKIKVFPLFKRGDKKIRRVEESKDFIAQPERAEKAVQETPPIAQFMTTYRAGDDLYDDSFSIDSDNGEFMGECGVGIAETIGVGDPKKVAALEVWLFDKNDVQTVTKLLLTEHVFNDPGIKQRLMSKGEPALAQANLRFVLETASLQLEARIIDMVYGRGPLPENSFFNRLTLEISVWPKAA